MGRKGVKSYSHSSFIYVWTTTLAKQGESVHYTLTNALTAIQRATREEGLSLEEIHSIPPGTMQSHVVPTPDNCVTGQEQ